MAEVSFAGGIVPPKQDPNNPQYVKGEILVKFKDETQILQSLAKGIQQTGISTIDQLNQTYQVEKMEKVFKNAKPRLTKPTFKDYTGKIHQVPNLDKIYKLNYKDKIDPVELSKKYEEDPNIEYAEPNYIAQICIEPNDPYFGDQWGLHNTGQYHLNDADIDAPEAWEVEKGDTTVIIGIIDTGVDWGHPDLVDKIINTGYDFVNDDNDAMDDNGHGSHVAGIAAASTDNEVGIASIAWNCKILPVKVLQSNGYGTYSDVANGVTYAANNGANIINLSLGGYAESYVLRDALENAYTTAVIVAAAGNDGTTHLPGTPWTPFYPAAWSFVIGVGASGMFYDKQTDTWYEGVASFSNGGLNTDLYAPGVNIYSTIPLFHPHSYSYASWNGTSMAAPFITGTVALIRSYYSDWSNELIHGQLINTTDEIVGGIRLNAYKSLTEIAIPQLSLYSHTIIDTLPGCDQDGIADAGETIEMVFDIQNTWAQAYNVQTILRYHSYEDTCFVTIIDTISTFGGGVSPYAHVNNETNPYKFYVKSSTPNNTDVYFDYEITCDGGYNFSGTFYITTQRGIEISGIIREDMTLTNDYLYIVTANVLVDGGVTLTIEPGTRIQFCAGKYLRIDGTLIAIGEEDSLIIFTSNAQNPAAGDWEGIKFHNSTDAIYDDFGNYVAGTIIRYSEIEFGGIIYADNCSPYIVRNYIHDNLTFSTALGGVITLFNSDSHVEYNKVILNSSRIGTISVCDENRYINSSAYINRNFIIDNYGQYSGAIYLYYSSPIISRNFICGNSSGKGGAIGSLTSYCNPLIEQNSISHNSNGSLGIGCFSAIRMNSYANFRNNTVLHNNGGIYVSFSEPNIYKNNIINNVIGYNYEIKRGLDGPDDVMHDIIVRNNYWGTINTDSIDTWIWDYYDDFDLGKVIYQPFETEPIVDAPGFLYQVALDPPSPIGCEVDTFNLIFSKPMDISIQPNVKFGVCEPYTQHIIEGAWVDSTNWQGTYTFSITTGDGINHLRVTTAKDCEGMEIPKDTRFSFVLDATGASSVGFIAQAGIGKVDLEWNGQDMVDLMGYNMYRYHNLTDSTCSDPILVNTSMITDTTYCDMSVVPYVHYYYMYTGISTDFNESDHSDPASATPFDADPGDANGDMSVNVLDIISIVNYMLQTNPQPFLFDASDINSDGVINVLDIIGVVNIILQAAPKMAGVDAEEAIFSLKDEQLIVSSDGVIGGYQFKVHGKINDLQVTSLYPMEIVTHKIPFDTLLIMAYSLDLASIPEGNNPVLSFSNAGDIELSDLIVSDRLGKKVNARFGSPGETLVPDIFALEQNYPNPFNNTTVIKYSLPKTTDVTIKFYNILGQIVHTHKVDNMAPGYYSYLWNGKNDLGQMISSGIYFYQLEADGPSAGSGQVFMETKKMVLLK